MPTTAKHWVFSLVGPVAASPAAADDRAAAGGARAEREDTGRRADEDSRLVRDVAKLVGIEEGPRAARR